MFPRYNQGQITWKKLAIDAPGEQVVFSRKRGRCIAMGLWGVLIDILKTAASHAAPHVAKSAVDMARERMAANDAARRESENAEELSQALSLLGQRVVAAEQRATAAETQLTALQDYFARKWASARVWVIALLCWNVILTGFLVYLFFARR